MINRRKRLLKIILLIVLIAIIGYSGYNIVLRSKPKRFHFLLIEGDKGASLTAVVEVKKIQSEQEYSKKVLCNLYSRDHRLVVADTTDYMMYLDSMVRHSKLFFEVAEGKSHYIKRDGGIEIPFPDAIGILSDYLNSSTSPGIVKELELKISERISLWCKINKNGENELFILVDGTPFERMHNNNFPHSALITAAKEFCDVYE